MLLFRSRPFLAVLVSAGLSMPAAVLAQGAPPPAPPRVPKLAVDVKNSSEPVLCAEKDNVALEFASPDVRHFKIEAAHPAYIGSLMRDSFAADWTDCDMTGDPVFPAQPRKVTFYESIDLWLVGYTFPSFWRPNDVPVRVGDRVERGLHLIQLWVLDREGAYEAMVLYPPDGYWRARPLPPSNLRWAAYGSSFMIGPVEFDKRPVVNLKEIAFDPPTRTFTVTFQDGNSAKVKLDKLDQERQVIDVTFDKPVVGKPFAALRSMYVTEFNADVARVAGKGPNAVSWLEEPVMSFKGGRFTDLWTGRLVPSRHNTSAPDFVFRDFTAEPPKPAPRSAPATAKP